MAEPIRFPAAAGLVELLRRYYAGEAGLWGEIQAEVAAELRARGLPAAPRHLRFLRSGEGYLVLIEDAEGYSRP